MGQTYFCHKRDPSARNLTLSPAALRHLRPYRASPFPIDAAESKREDRHELTAQTKVLSSTCWGQKLQLCGAP